MKDFRRLLKILLALVLISPAAASISIEFHLGAVDVPAGSLGVIVVDTGDDGFEEPALVPGVPLTPGEALGQNDVVIAVFSNANLSEWAGRRGFASHFAEINYETLGVEEGQAWILYVFPDRAANDPVRTGEPHVALRPTDLSGFTANSSIGPEMPADGGAYLLAMLDADAGGTADLAAVDIAPADLDDGEGQLQRTLSPTGRHTYYFEMTQAGFLSISGTGTAGLRGLLYHRDGQLIASSNGTLPFWFEEQLEAGFHSLVLYREDGGSSDEPYEIEIASEWVRFVRPDIAIGSNFGNLLTAGQVFAPGAEVPLVSKKARKVSGVATVGNLGDRPEGIAVRATRGTRVFRVNYSSPQGNITSGLITGAYRTPVLTSASAPVWIKSRFAPSRKKLLASKGKRSAVKKRAFSCVILANSVSDPSLYDGGKWKVRIR
jgi:hypothetical protein